VWQKLDFLELSLPTNVAVAAIKLFLSQNFPIDCWYTWALLGSAYSRFLYKRG